MLSSNSRIFVILLTGINVVLASVLGFQFAKDTPSLEGVSVVAPKAAHEQALASSARFSMPSLSAFSELVERPLFSRSRRPSASMGALALSAEEGPALVLNGIIVTGKDKIALLAAPTSERMTPLREGEALAGWTLVSVHPDRVAIRSGSKEQEIFIADTLKMNDSLARRRAEQLRAQQLMRQQVMRQQARQAPRQPIAGGKAAELPPSESPADPPRSSEHTPEQQQNQQEDRHPEQHPGGLGT